MILCSPSIGVRSDDTLGEWQCQFLPDAIQSSYDSCDENVGACAMLRTVEGVYKNGKIDVSEIPESVLEGTRVIVTFLEPVGVDLRSVGIDEEQAADLRSRLTTFAQHWDDPSMDVYDDYDNNKRQSG
jgi:hypothetical protein